MFCCYFKNSGAPKDEKLFSIHSGKQIDSPPPPHPRRLRSKGVAVSGLGEQSSPTNVAPGSKSRRRRNMWVEFVSCSFSP